MLGARRGLAPVVQKLDSAIQRINLYPVDSEIAFPNTYPLDSNLSGGQRYPAFEQLGPDVYVIINILYRPSTCNAGSQA